MAVVLGDPRIPYSYATGGKFGSEELEAVEALQRALSTLEGFEFRYFDDHDRLIDELREARPDLVLNLCDTGIRNDWQRARNVPALFEVLDLPYTGADPVGIILSDDKSLIHASASLRGVPVPEQTFIQLDDQSFRLPERYPTFIKPNAGAGSFGITEKSLAHSPDEARAYLEWLAPRLEVPEAVAQEFLSGTEYTIGVIGNPEVEVTVLPPLEIDFSELDAELPQVLTHGSKADPDSPYWKQLKFKRAQLHEATEQRLVEYCKTLFGCLGLRDYARIDFRNDAEGKPRLLDANCNPTWYPEGKMAMMASWAGYEYPTLLRLILESAMARYGISTR